MSNTSISSLRLKLAALNDIFTKVEHLLPTSTRIHPCLDSPASACNAGNNSVLRLIPLVPNLSGIKDLYTRSLEMLFVRLASSFNISSSLHLAAHYRCLELLHSKPFGDIALFLVFHLVQSVPAGALLASSRKSISLILGSVLLEQIDNLNYEIQFVRRKHKHEK